MKVRWSSTYLMLDRAERKREVRNDSQMKYSFLYHFIQCVDAFVEELRWEENDTAKRAKIRELKLTAEEWMRVKTFLGLLSVCLLLLH
jgi:hypothetical protein